MRSALVLTFVLAAGCKKHEATPTAGAAEPVAVAKTPPAGEPAGMPVGSAATAGSDDAAFERLTRETLDYTYRMVPLLASFDGDCDAQIARMKQLEPLVQQIRDDEAAVAPDFNGRIKDYMQAHKAEVVAKIEEQLAAAHVTRPQLEAKEADIKAKCTSPAFADEMNRIGVLKKQ